MIPQPYQRRAFSLIELLVVCAIIGIIVGFTIPAATTMMRGSQLTQGSQLLNDQIGLARQTALARNRAVEVRFFRFADPEVPGEDPLDKGTWNYRGFQLFEILENGVAVPLSEFRTLPNTVIMNPGRLSSLLDDAVRGEPKRPGPTDPEIPRLSSKKIMKEESYEFQAFRFRQDGSTDLPSAGENEWYVTLHGINDRVPEDASKPPPNFFTLQVDPVSGATRSFRPNAG